MRTREDISKRKKLIKKLEENGVASSQAEAERIADRMLDTNDKVQKQHDAHRRAKEDEDAETPDETHEGEDAEESSNAEAKQDRKASFTSQGRDQAPTSQEESMSEETRKTIEKQKKQAANYEPEHDPVKPSEAEEYTAEEQSTKTIESPSEEESHEETEDEAAQVSEDTQSDEPEETSSSSTTQEDDGMGPKVAQSKDEAEESNIDLGNVFDTSK
jgi:hypothetical protein